MTDRNRRVFADAFKREAVERARTSGMTIVAVAEELGLHETVLRRWIARFGGSTTVSPAGRPPAAASMMPSPAENARLKRELHRTGSERDILERPLSSSAGILRLFCVAGLCAVGVRSCGQLGRVIRP
ncbi:transposase [Hasllibacter halocynthiae]|uniref:transposase n=1 Tax=Hasllibacter halocynthiae TaxID=595589 RepID=UPI000D058FFC